MDVYTLDSQLQRVFVFGFFLLMSGLLVYVKRTYIQKKPSKISFGASVLISLVLLVIFQNTFLPREKENNISLYAVGDGEVWLTDVKIDGERVSVIDLDIFETANWEYNELYDDYVYYPYNNLPENELGITFLGESITINFAVNDWSGKVDIKSPDGELRQIDLHDEKEGAFEYQNNFIREYGIFERIFYNIGILIAVVFCMCTLLEALTEKTQVSIITIATLLIASTLFATLATFQSILMAISEEPIQYCFQVRNEKNPESSGAEVRIYEIKISGKLYDLYLLSDYGSVQEDGTLLIYPYIQNVSFNIEAHIFDTIEVTLLQHPYSGILYVSDGKNEDSTDLFSETAQVITKEYRCEDSNTYILNYVEENQSELGVMWLLFVLIGLICFGLIRVLLIKIGKETFSWWMIPLLCIPFFILSIVSIYGLLYLSPIVTVIIISLLSVYFVVRNRNAISTHLENIYVVIAVIYGISMLLILPIGHVPDEFAHEAKCYAMAEAYANTTGNRYAVWLPKETSETFAFFAKDVMYLDLKYTPVNVLTSYKTHATFGSNLVWTHSSNTLSLNEFAYFPATLIVAVAHFVPMSPTLIFQLGRLLNFMIASVLFYLAIKITPCYKRIFFMIALFPITIQQTAAVNQDWITNAVVFLFVAITFRFAFAISILHRKDYLKILALSCCLGMIKLAYFPVAFLVLLIPIEKFEGVYVLATSKERKIREAGKSVLSLGRLSKRQKSWLFKLLIIVLAFGLAVSQALPSYLHGEQHLADCNFFTLHMVIENPLKAIQICWNTFNERATLDFCDGLLNGFGWSIKWTTGVTRSLIMMAALFLVLTNQEDTKLKSKHKAIILCAMLGMWGMVYMALLTGWTDANSPTIAGLQSRYFIPVILLMYILFHNRTFQNKSEKINCWFCGFAVVALTVGMKTLACGYYQM